MINLIFMLQTFTMAYRDISSSWYKGAILRTDNKSITLTALCNTCTLLLHFLFVLKLVVVHQFITVQSVLVILLYLFVIILFFIDYIFSTNCNLHVYHLYLSGHS